jgi:hypothetical protein
MNLSLKTTYVLVVALAIFGANPCPAAESFPTATPASQGLAAPAQAESVPDLAGTWHGVAKTPTGETALVLHVERGADGTLSAKIATSGRRHVLTLDCSDTRHNQLSPPNAADWLAGGVDFFAQHGLCGGILAEHERPANQRRLES